MKQHKETARNGKVGPSGSTPPDGGGWEYSGDGLAVGQQYELLNGGVATITRLSSRYVYYTVATVEGDRVPVLALRSILLDPVVAVRVR